jgi:hypothetical protein
VKWVEAIKGPRLGILVLSIAGLVTAMGVRCSSDRIDALEARVSALEACE